MHLPSMNLNGTAPETLMYDASFAVDSLVTAYLAVQDMEPHGRDYPNGGYENARAEHTKLLDRLDAILDEVRQYRDGLAVDLRWQKGG